MRRRAGPAFGEKHRGFRRLRDAPRGQRHQSRSSIAAGNSTAIAAIRPLLHKPALTLALVCSTRRPLPEGEGTKELVRKRTLHQ
jgi:hypothetical protein